MMSLKNKWSSVVSKKILNQNTEINQEKAQTYENADRLLKEREKVKAVKTSDKPEKPYILRIELKKLLKKYKAI